MARKLGDPENFRVVINPYSAVWLFSNGKPQDQITCERMVEEIKRHVDNIGHITIEFDEEPMCEHCGAAWTEDSRDFNGGCCSRDMDAEPQEDEA